MTPPAHVASPVRDRPRRAALAAVVLACAALVVSCGDEDTSSTPADDTSTTPDAATTDPGPDDSAGTDGSDGTAPTVPVGTEVSGAADAAAAAEAFAVDVIGFVDPALGSVETDADGRVRVPVSPPGASVRSVVTLEEHDDRWAVLGSASDSIVVDSPSAGEELGSTLEPSGSATAFEGTVVVRVRSQRGELVGEGFVTGGANGRMGAIEGQVQIDASASGPGSVEFVTESAADGGGVLAATVVPVRLGGG